MAVTKRLPWQRQVCWTKDTHAKMFPVTFQEKSQNLGVLAYTVTKLHNFKVETGLKSPPPPGLNRVKTARRKKLQVAFALCVSTPELILFSPFALRDTEILLSC